MPDPKGFKDKDEWMGACMLQLRNVEGKPQDQSVAICLDMWQNKDKKKAKGKGSKKAAYDYIRDLATSIIYKFSEGDEEVTQPDVKGFFDADISASTTGNPYFRKVLYTGPKSQLVLMSLKPSEDIGEEVHEVDQFFRIEQGKGDAIINGTVYKLNDDSVVIVPAGAKHNFVNTGEEALKLYTVYSPAHHKEGTVHKTKSDAVKDNEEYDGKTTEIMSKTAKLGESYSYASTQVDLPDDLSKKIQAWGKVTIPKEELTGVGLEDEIHSTILYGLKNDDPTEIKNLLRFVRPFDIRLGLITHFDTPEYDVLKIAVDSPALENMHYLFESKLDNDNSFPTFHPHVTIAYLKKGMAKKYIGSDIFRGETFRADHIVFSTKDNKKSKIGL